MQDKFIELNKAITLISRSFSFSDDISMSILTDAMMSGRVVAYGYRYSSAKSESIPGTRLSQSSIAYKKIKLDESAIRTDVNISIYLSDVVKNSIKLKGKSPSDIEIIKDINFNLSDLNIYLSDRFYWPYNGKIGRPRKESAWLIIITKTLKMYVSGAINDKKYLNKTTLKNALSKDVDHSLDHRSIHDYVEAIQGIMIDNSKNI